MMRARLAALVLLLGSSIASAQTPQQPVFRGGVEVVEVDVSVVNDNGRPITDLLGPDFTVTVDGQPRRVVSAQFVTMRPTEPRSRLKAADKPEVFFSSNAGVERGRLIVLAFDRDGISFGGGRPVTSAASRFLDTLGTSDRVAFVTVPQPGPVVDFTTNFELVRKELDRAVGLAQRPRLQMNLGIYEAFTISTGSDGVVALDAVVRLCGRFPLQSVQFLECQIEVSQEASIIVADVRRQVDNSIRGLEAIIEGLSEIEGPKSLVWISEGLFIDGPGAELASPERLAAEAGVTVSVMLIESPLGDASEVAPSPTRRQDREAQIRGLEMVAGFTRGTLYRVVSSAEPLFQRLEDELSGYYLLAIETVPSDKDGKRHPISVSVRRRGANLRARREFRIAPDADAKNVTVEDQLARTLRSPFAATDLPLRLATYAYQDPQSSKVRVMLATEIDKTTKDPEQITIAFTLTDVNGRIAAGGTQRPTLTPVDGLRGPLLEYASMFSVDPGTYTLKLAAIDAGGRRGSLEHPVQAWQMTGVPFAVGDLLLADTPTTPGELIHPPVEARLATGSLAAYLELYSDQPATLDTTLVRIEVAATDTGPALASAPGRLETSADSKSRIVTSVVPVGALPPGQYVARAIVTRGDAKVGELTRPFQITPASVVARVGTPAGSALAPAALLASMLSPIAAFQRADLLKSDVLGLFMDLLDKGRPALKGTTALVRAGKMKGTGLQALEAGDQLAATFLRGLELYSNGELDQAAVQFAAAVRVSPDFSPALFYLGACFAAAGRDQEATIRWSAALTGPDNLPLVYSALGDALFRTGDVGKAIVPLREALSKWPEDDQVRRRLALAYAVTQQHKEALATIEPYLPGHPSDHEAILIALHAIYASAVLGQPLLEGTQNRDRITMYAAAYATAKGPHAALITTWADFVAKR
jgi:VWFA-related protein